MNSRQKELQQVYLDSEKECLNALKKTYKDALKDIDDKIAMLLGRSDSDMQHVIYQVEYQKALKGQIEAILTQLQGKEFDSISEYLADSYNQGFIGTMYDISGQGIPLIVPIDQKQVVKAIKSETKLSDPLYTKLGKDTKQLSKQIAAEISRGIATAIPYKEIARNIANRAVIPQNNAMRIARTEAHRIRETAAAEAQFKARDKGCDIVKQWLATLDGRTRDSHAAVDGEIREIDEKFSNGLMFPADPHGRAAEVINCRCTLLSKPKWALSDRDLQRMQDRAEYYGLDKTENFADFSSKYLNAAQQEADDAQKTNDTSAALEQIVKISKKPHDSEYGIVDRELVNSKEYHDKFEELGISKNTSEKSYEISKLFLEKADGTEKEYLAVLDARTGKEVFNSLSLNNAIANKVAITEEQYNHIISYNGNVMLVHNHPANGRPSGTDIVTAYNTPNVVGSIVPCHDGTLYYISDIKKDSNIDKIYQKHYDDNIRNMLGIPDDEVIHEQIDSDVINACKIKATTELYKENKSKKYFTIRRL